MGSRRTTDQKRRLRTKKIHPYEILNNQLSLQGLDKDNESLALERNRTEKC